MLTQAARPMAGAIQIGENYKENEAVQLAKSSNAKTASNFVTSSPRRA